MQKTTTTRPFIGLMMTGLLLAAAAPVCFAQQNAEPQSATVAVQGVQVAIDPATGRLVAPTDAQRAALSAAMLKQATTPNLKANQWPQTTADAAKTLRRFSSGRYSAVMQVPESLTSSLVAERQKDGSLTIHHQGDGAGVKAEEVTQ